MAGHRVLICSVRVGAPLTGLSLRKGTWGCLTDSRQRRILLANVCQRTDHERPYPYCLSHCLDRRKPLFRPRRVSEAGVPNDRSTGLEGHVQLHN